MKCMAGGQGFEPRLMEPESIVLPLDDPPILEKAKRAPAAYRQADPEGKEHGFLGSKQ